MENNNIVSFSPHIKGGESLKRIYLNLSIALAPALLFGFVIYGINAILITLLCAVSTMGYDIVYNLIKTKKFAITDWSTLFTALAISATMPAGVPCWYPIIGCVVAEFVIKRLSGGNGKYFVNPTAVATIVTLIGFSGALLCYTTPFKHIKTGESLIAILHNGTLPEGGIMKVLFGLTIGGIGEVAVLFLLVGGIYLCVVKVIDYKVPVIYLATVLIFSMLFFGVEKGFYCIFAGGAVLCAFFLLTDFAVCPKSLLEKCVYSIIAGIVTVLMWKYAKNYAMGAYYATMIVTVVASATRGLYRPKITGEIKTNEK